MERDVENKALGPDDREQENKELYQGIAYGGPVDGKELVSRFPKGILLVDKANNRCWIYEWVPGARGFNVRSEEPMKVQTEGEKNRYRAAEEPNYDVVAFTLSVGSIGG